MKKEIELLDLIRKHSSCKTNEEVFKLIDKDDQELVKVLIQAYEKNKEEYLFISQNLKDKKFAIKFESSKELSDTIKEIDDTEAAKELPLSLDSKALDKL